MREEDDGSCDMMVMARLKWLLCPLSPHSLPHTSLVPSAIDRCKGLGSDDGLNNMVVLYSTLTHHQLIPQQLPSVEPSLAATFQFLLYLWGSIVFRWLCQYILQLQNYSHNQNAMKNIIMKRHGGYIHQAFF